MNRELNVKKQKQNKTKTRKLTHTTTTTATTMKWKQKLIENPQDKVVVRSQFSYQANPPLSQLTEVA